MSTRADPTSVMFKTLGDRGLFSAGNINTLENLLTEKGTEALKKGASGEDDVNHMEETNAPEHLNVKKDA